MTSIKGAKGALSVPACSLWPYKFVSQLLARLVERRVINVQTNTAVTKMVENAESGYTTLYTPCGVIKARKVVLATNGYTAGIASAYKDKIVPIKATASYICPPLPVSPHLSHTYNINYTPNRVDYLNPRPHGGIVVGGGQWTYQQDREKWYNKWDDSTLLEEARPHFDGLMQPHFKGWEDSGAKLKSMWTGIQGITPDGLPHVGEVPGSGGRQYILAGFNGGGMAMILLCAQGVAKMVSQGVPYEESGLPWYFKSSRERLA